MNYPSVQVGNFFDNPNYVLDYCNSLEYHKSDGGYPGARTKSLRDLDSSLFAKINSKIIRLLYPDWNVYQKIQWNADTFFQKINDEDVKLHLDNKEHPGKGWIHNDFPSKFTAIIYLSKEKDCGTIIYSKKDGFVWENNNDDFKRSYYKKEKQNSKLYMKELNKNLNQYDVECTYNSSFNKLIGFDGATPHGAFFNMKPQQERITLISFISYINVPYFPIPEMRRT